MDQRVIDRAVALATKAAISGQPVERIVWSPPQSASDDPGGNFIIIPCSNLKATDTPPWELYG